MKNAIGRYIATAVALTAVACSTPDSTKNDMNVKPPIAEKQPFEIVTHGDTRIDNYYWMRLSDEQKNATEPDEQTKKVVAYLEAENAYTKGTMAHTEALQTKLFEEMKGRIKEADQSVPVKDNGYWYYTRFELGQDYAYYCRKKESLETGKEEVLIDGPAMAKDKAYWSLGGFQISEDNKWMVYGIDEVSRRIYTLFIKNIETGEVLAEKLEGTTGSTAWAADNKTIFYGKKDPTTLRDNQVWRHVVGTDQSKDVLVYTEADEEFSCFVYKTKSSAFLVIGSNQTLSNEYRVLEANNPTGNFRLIQERERNLEYGIDHYGDKFYIVTNYEAQNFRLMECPLNATTKSNWKEVIAHRPDVLLEGIEIFSDFLVVDERKNGLTQLRLIRWSDKSEHYMSFPDPAYAANVGANPDFNTEILRFTYSSLVTPSSTFDYNMTTKERKLLKQQEVVGGYDANQYQSERLYATATDGTKVPISLVYKKGFERNAQSPLLLYAYGSYGYSIDATFSSSRLSLLDRGFVYAIAHIRGGQEMGRQWYEDGKLLKKKNTFTDFIDCGKFLCEQKYTSPEGLFAMGGSAGGLLMGAIANMAPQQFKGIVSAVPFVDVVTTMLDETIPLTTFEFDEWGNPKDSVYYQYMKSYSPYDNIEAKAYPNILVTTGYWDSQVQYWEPAKYIAKMRELKTDNNLLLFWCNMDAGHGGKSGRFESLKEVALEYAFMLDLVGIKK
jgi:oligopeptidase B